ncbi:MAG TPA: hypothetical protein VF082_12045 [Jiangellaceae bacterium]
MRRRRRSMLALGSAALLAGVLAMGGCSESEPPRAETSAPEDSATGPASATAMPAGDGEQIAQPAAPPADEPTAPEEANRVSYGWAVPSDQVTIPHPAQMPVPYLVAIYVGDHPEDSTPYQRISFYFREGFPEYNLQYVRSVLGEGTGTPIALQGNSSLRVGFVNAQAHDDAGASTLETAPDSTIGFTNLKSYGSAGDFEGHVTYGLGIQVAPNSDQVLPVRAGELTRSDGSNGTYHVVYVDLQTG